MINKKMKIYIMDKSFEYLKKYEVIVNSLYSKENVKYFTHCSDLEKAVKQEVPDAVFIDVDNEFGYVCAKRIKELNSNLKIIITTSENRLALEALQHGKFLILQKPFDKENIKKILNSK